MLIELLLKWDDYNPRSDAKSWHWFRFQNDFFDDDKLCDLTGRQQLLLIYLFTRRNKSSEPVFEITPTHIVKRIDIFKNVDDVINEINGLVELGLVQVHAYGSERKRTDKKVGVRKRTRTYGSERERTDLFPTDVTNVTDVTDITNETDGYDGHSANAAPSAQVMILDAEVIPAPVGPAKRAKAPPGEKTGAGRVWEAYRAAYARRYGHDPVRNAKVNAQCSQLVARLGAEDAERVVAFYVTHNGSFYVRGVHPLGACLKDAEGLRTQMLAGHRVTSAEAKRLDQGQGIMQDCADIAAKLEAELAIAGGES